MRDQWSSCEQYRQPPQRGMLKRDVIERLGDVDTIEAASLQRTLGRKPDDPWGLTTTGHS